MTVLTSDRRTKAKVGSLFAQPVAAAAVIYNGGLVNRNAAGYAAPATDTALEKLMGVADEPAANSAGANGALTVGGHRVGAFLFAASGMAQVHTGQRLYVIDDQTVGLGVVTQPAAVTGVTVERAAVSKGGSGSLAYTATGTLLAYAGGTAVNVGTNGVYELTSANGDLKILVTVVAANLAGSNQNDTVALRHVYAGVCESVESANAVWVDITSATN